MINTSEAFSHAPQNSSNILICLSSTTSNKLHQFCVKKKRKICWKWIFVVSVQLQITSHQNDRSVYVLLYLLCEFIYFKYYTRNVCGSNKAIVRSYMDNSLSIQLCISTHLIRHISHVFIIVLMINLLFRVESRISSCLFHFVTSFSSSPSIYVFDSNNSLV